MDSASFLVTGGCGLQGTHIVVKLREQYPSAAVAVMSRNPTANVQPGVAYHTGDITSPDDIARVFAAAKPTVVFHCAGVMTVNRATQSDELVRAINYEGARYVLEESQRRDLKALVFTSSASVTQRHEGGFKDIVNGDESAQTVQEEDKSMIYPKTKAAAERLILAADTPGGLRTCSLRPAIIYGEYDNDMIPTIMRVYRSGRHRVQVGDGSNMISVTYGGNSANAHLLAAARLLADDPTGVAGEAFFITNGEPVPFWGFSRAVWRAAGDTTQPVQIRQVSATLAWVVAYAAEWVAWFRGTKPALSTVAVRFSTMSRWFNIQKARDVLGYEPKVQWDEGVRRGVQWYLENEKKKE